MFAHTIHSNILVVNRTQIDRQIKGRKKEIVFVFLTRPNYSISGETEKL